MKSIGRLLTSFCGGILAFISGCAGRAAAYMGPPPRMRARVQDSKTGKPIAGLRVELLQNKTIVLRTKTAQDGTFSLPRSGNSGYTVTITDIDGKKNGEYRVKSTAVPAGRTQTRFTVERID